MCPNVTELRTSYNPFSTFNIEVLTWEPQPPDQVGLEGGTEDDLPETSSESFSSVLPELPQFITCPPASHLRRLCFDRWEFFPGIECAMDDEMHDGPHTSVTSAEEFLASVTAQQDISVEPVPDSLTIEVDTRAQERSERLISAYRRVLDHVFEGFGGKMTPNLQTIQFDFHSGHLDIPDSCMDWWNGWLQKWQAMGLSVEGCQRQAL